MKGLYLDESCISHCAYKDFRFKLFAGKSLVHAKIFKNHDACAVIKQVR